MLRMNKDNSEYEIDRELTWKFAIEKNAEYQDRIAELEEENKKLKEEKEIRALNDRDNLIQIEKLGKENRNLKKKRKISATLPSYSQKRVSKS